ncbi:MAG: hypothetical protein K1060chlam2_00374 [Chlamydiae bacterium]|nr:hypothetical protein [Chlamydiota bacterium]
MGQRSIKYDEDYLYRRLLDPKKAASYLNECLQDDDPAVFLIAFRDVIKANGGMKQLAKEIECDRSGLYRTFSENGNPGINTLVDAMFMYGLEIQVKPIKSANLSFTPAP